MMSNSSYQRGFTLIEISMVIAIVALIMGGVMRGQELVTQARIRDVINDLNGVAAAYNFYYDRYKAIPGDDVVAGTRWGPGAKSGGGNGAISGKYFDHKDPSALNNDDNDESSKFWWHLRLAGFIDGAGDGPAATAQPGNSVGGIVGVQTGGLGLSSLIVCESSVPDKIAAAVDLNLDDQLPNSGVVRGYKQSSSNEDVTGKAPNVTVYEETGTSQYVVCKMI
ncbi:MAG: prepilin-type N-terminal cleavage/methylation domain-containing protein [Burkholderiales bacterium]